MKLKHVGIENGIVDRLMLLINRLSLHFDDRIFGTDMQQRGQLMVLP